MLTPISRFQWPFLSYGRVGGGHYPVNIESPDSDVDFDTARILVVFHLLYRIVHNLYLLELDEL
jgi:hypothetical protein